jgi:hypothetical protein
MSATRHLQHLARRLGSSLSRREPSAADVAWVDSHLLEGERTLWRRMTVADRRHSIIVARRFESLAVLWSRDEMAGALLHDVGKLDSNLGTLGRVVATIAGPRTARFRRYHDHERIGADMLNAAGSSAITIALVHGEGPAAAALSQADNI